MAKAPVEAKLPAETPRVPTLQARPEKGGGTCLPVQADGEPCVTPAVDARAVKDNCKDAAPGTRVTFTNKCAHAVHIHRYWTAAGPDGKMQNHRRLIVLSGAGDRRFYTDCPDGPTEKLLVSIPAGEKANARCR